MFASDLARAQALLGLLYQAYAFLRQGKTEIGQVIVEEAIPGLRQLKDEIDRGEVERGMERERRQWQEFIRMADRLDPGRVRNCFDALITHGTSTRSR